MNHYHYDIFEILDEERSRDGIKAFSHTSYDGRISKVAIPLEPSVEDIPFEKTGDKNMKDPEFLSQFIGDYDVLGANTKISFCNGALLKIMPGEPELKLEPVEGMVFLVRKFRVCQ